jgi:hypothetical protein
LQQKLIKEKMQDLKKEKLWEIIRAIKKINAHLAGKKENQLTISQAVKTNHLNNIW